MEAAPDEDSAVYVDASGEIVENVIEEEVHEEIVHDEDMLEVQHEEVLEEIVEEDGLMYDTDGRVIEYRDMMVYDEDTEVIEEYVEVEVLGDGRFAYVMTDEHGNRRLLKDEEVEAMKKMPEIMEEVLVDEKELEAGPSTSDGFSQHKRGRFPARGGASKQVRSRGMMGKGQQMMYVDREEFYHTAPGKRMNDMAKIEVEKYVPRMTINRRPMPDNFKPKPPRARKNPPWQDDSGAGPSSGPSTSALGHGDPIMKDPLFPIQEDEVVIRFKCPECGEGFPSMERQCYHMSKKHDCQTPVREADFFTDTEFEDFLVKVEKATLGKDINEVIRKKSRTGSSQVFVCNYMSKGSQKQPELVEVGMASLAERPMEVCTAFVQKVHSYESIHVKYCDQHIHFDGNIGFRVPLAVKRRLFEMSFKRLPIPCMQVLLEIEAVDLLPHPTRFEQKLKNLSHVEIVELLGIINASLRKQNNNYSEFEPRGRRIGIKFDAIKTSEGAQTLIVRRVDPPKKETEYGSSSGPSTSTQAIGFDGQEIPEIAREEEVLDDDMFPDDCDGVMEENFLYDPPNDRDPLIEELTEVELGILEAYERDVNIKLTEEQQKERLRQKIKYALSKVLSTYQSLDTATHGLAAAELHSDTINQLRQMSSFVVELSCQLGAEVKAQFNPALSIDEIKRDLLAGIAMQERTYQPERRPRRIGSGHPTPNKQQYRGPARSHEEYSQRIMMTKRREMGESPSVQRQMINISETFDDMSQQERLHILREETLKSNKNGSLEPDDEKPIVMAPIPDEMKAMPWVKPQRTRRSQGDPNAPPRKRGRPQKRDIAEIMSKVVEETVVEEVVKDQEMILVENPDMISSDIPTSSESGTETIVEEQPQTESQTSPIKNPVVETPKTVEPKEEPSAPFQSPPTPSQTSSTSSQPPVTPTTTRTGRVVKPKKFDDHEQ